MRPSSIRTIVVGAGAAGVPLATRISADAARTVTLIEAGSVERTPRDLLDGATMRGAVPGYRENWVYEVELARGRRTTIARGRTLGGSTTINGGYFVRSTRADFDRWAAIGGVQWNYAHALPLLRALESDLDFGATAVHGDDGPVPVVRPSQSAPASAAFIAAARELGFPHESDKNAPGAPGVGAVPSNVVSGTRVNTGLAYAIADAPPDRPHVIGGVRVLRVIMDGRRTVGVEVADVQHRVRVIEADEVVLAAGALATPQLLMLSGIGPRAQLRRFGIPVIADLPVGTAFSDHPNLALTLRAKPGVSDRSAPYGFPTALNFDASRVDRALPSCPEGDIELLLTAKPLEYLLTGEDDGGDALQVLVGLQGHTGRGTLSLRSADPLDQPNVDYRYLEHSDDRRRMRAGVRTAAQLVESPAFAGVFDGLVDLDAATLHSDARLDAWILAHLGTALHTCGTAPLGAVVDGGGRVLGLEGLWVADTSILPTAPHRGPANTAVFIGEFVARQMLARASGVSDLEP